MLRLGGLSGPYSGGASGGREEGAVEAAVSPYLRPTRERWRGPVDLDAAAAARADEINATWVASAGEPGRASRSPDAIWGQRAALEFPLQC